MFSGLVWRITAPLVGVSVLLLALGGFTAWYVHEQQQEATSLLVDSIEMADASQTLENRLRDLRNRLNQFVISGDPAHLQTAEDLANRVGQSLSVTERLDISPDGQRLLVEIRREYVVFTTSLQETLKQSGPTDHQTAIMQLVDQRLTGELLERAGRHREAQEARVADASRRSQVIADRVSLTLLLLGTCGAIGGVIAGLAAARSVQRSIFELNVPVQAAAGMLNEVVGPVRISADGNIEEIRGSLDQLADRVATTVERLQSVQRDSIRAEQLAAVGQLAAGLAHEIRNPLTAMKTIVQLARRQGGADALTDRDVEILDQEITRLNKHVQIFLDYAKPPKLERQSVDVGDLLRRTVELTNGQAGQRGIDIRLSLPEAIPRLEGDPGQLQQVLLNLVLNAMDAQPDGGSIEVRVSDWDELDAASVLLIEILDKGPGLPPDVRSRIFDPFFSTKETGTGIGLAVCQRVIEEHGGSITADNRPEGGAVFSVRIPLDERGPLTQASTRAVDAGERGNNEDQAT